jgi:hypothetical protein
MLNFKIIFNKKAQKNLSLYIYILFEIKCESLHRKQQLQPP